MTFGSICSGIEAASVAWHPLGWCCAFVSEIEPFPCAVLKHHHPDTPNHGDLTKFKEWPRTGIDVLVGGTPCQSFSVAGLRKGLDDSRGNLALTFLGVVERFAPTWVVWENVPGVLSVDGGRAFGSFLGGLAQLRYGFAYAVLDAQYFGLAQRRKRVFVVGHSGGQWQRAAAVLFDAESVRGNPPPRRETGQGTARQLEPSLGASGRGFSRAGDTRGQDAVIPAFQNTGQGWWNESQTAQTLRDSSAGGASHANIVAHSLKAGGFDASEDGTGRGTPLIAHSLCSRTAKGGDPTTDTIMPVAFTQNQSGDVLTGSVAASIGTNQNATGRNTAKVMSRMAVRRLTPTECEKLQGFPPGYTLVPYRGKPAADGPRYKALGNSMAVPVMRWIGERIQIVESL